MKRLILKKFTLKVGLSWESCFQHSLIISIINWGPNSLGNFILFFNCNSSITSLLLFPGQGFPPLENISNKTTPKENTSLFVEVLSLNITSGAHHYFI